MSLPRRKFSVKPNQKVSDFAIIATGGKQYLVAPGQVLTVEKLAAQTAGDKIVFDQVLLVKNGEEIKVGTPTVSGASVNATSLGDGRGQKVVVVHYKSKVRYHKKAGHRQPFTKVKVDSIA